MRLQTANGYEFEIDDEDYEKINCYHWIGHNSPLPYIYAHGKIKNKRRLYISLHRFLINAPKGSMVDHANRNTLDNRKSNLRFCNKSKNRINSLKQYNNSSGYKGVRKARNTGKKWEARIRYNRNLIYLGLFISKEEAALAYNNAALKYFGEFAYLNEVYGG